MLLLLIMSTYFIDYEGFHLNGETIIKELCIMDANNMLNPRHYIFKPIIPWSLLNDNARIMYLYQNDIDWDEGSELFCPKCIVTNNNAIFYTLDDKFDVLQKNFPTLRLIRYNIKDLPEIPYNISCPYKDHGKHCAFKNCIAMCTNYCQC